MSILFVFFSYFRSPICHCLSLAYTLYYYNMIIIIIIIIIIIQKIHYIISLASLTFASICCRPGSCQFFCINFDVYLTQGSCEKKELHILLYFELHGCRTNSTVKILKCMGCLDFVISYWGWKIVKV